MMNQASNDRIRTNQRYSEVEKNSFSLYTDCFAKRLLLEGIITAEQYDKLLEINKNLNIHTS